MTREEIIDGLEIYTVGKMNKDKVHITVEELQKFIDAIKTLQEPYTDNVISREAALKCFTLDNTKADVWNNIKALPPATSKLIECEDCVSRQTEEKPCTYAISQEDALQALCKAVHKNDDTIPCPNQRVSCLWNKTKVQDYAEEILKLPPVTPVEKLGKWLRISDYRYQCSCCGNVVHFSSEENLYRFSRWCGKCGSNNDRGQVE
jgi:hypothetical protein